MDSKVLSKIFTFLVITLPILSVYKSPVEYFDLGTFLMIIFIPFILQKSEYRIRNDKPLIFFLSFIILSSLILITYNSLNFTPILRMVKFVTLISVVLLMGYQNLFYKRFALKVLKYVTNAAVIYLILQVVLYRVFGIFLPNGIPALADNDAYLANIYISATRPSSFFLEPAHFAQYSLAYLSFCLFGKKEIKNFNGDWKNIVFIAAGIILSTSGQGLLLLGILICMWIVWKFFFVKIDLKGILLLILVIVILISIIPVLFNSSVVTSTLTRLLTTDVNNGGNAVVARLGGYQYLSYLSGINSFIGMGFGNTPDFYLSGYAYIIYCTGYIGLAVFLFVLLRMLKRSEFFYQKSLIIIFSIMLIGAQMFTATSICFYFALIYLQINGLKKQTKTNL